MIASFFCFSSVIAKLTQRISCLCSNFVLLPVVVNTIAISSGSSDVILHRQDEV